MFSLSLSLSAGLVFSLSSFQFHRCGVCGLIFAIWFFVGLDCGFCPLGFCFSLSWLLVPGFWFLGLGWVFYFLWVDFFGSGFWFSICFRPKITWWVQLAQQITRADGSNPNIWSAAGPIFVHQILSGRAWVSPKPDPTRPMNSPIFINII